MGVKRLFGKLDQRRYSWWLSKFPGLVSYGNDDHISYYLLLTSGNYCYLFADTFHLNPQYRITMRKTDGPDGLATCIVALMQKDRRKLRTQGLDLMTVGFAVYHVIYLHCIILIVNTVHRILTFSPIVSYL